MFHLENKTKISLPIAVWLAHDSYDYDDRKNVISMTGLLKPTRMVVLGMKFAGESKTVDVENLIASSMGTALHDNVEYAWKDKKKAIETLARLGYKEGESIFNNITFEKRSEIKVGKWIISGKFDIVFAGYVQDVKSTTVWAWMNDSNKYEHQFQLSGYKLLNPDLITKDKGYIEYIFTDWSKMEALRNRQYPQSRVATKEVDLFSDEQMLELIETKIDDIEEQLELTEPELRDCTDEELWATADTWKYYKNPNSTKRATKNFDNPIDANTRMAQDGNVGIVKLVAGEAKRCKYCNFTEICSQYKKLKKEGRVND